MHDIFDPLIKIYKVLYLFAYDITGNYGISLLLLSFFTFIVLYPFTQKAKQMQEKEHKIQSVISPQVEAIKKQYSGREQYEQLQWLYRRYGYHPVFAIRSALGFMFQIPFLTTAYYMLSELAEIQGVPWGIIPDLGAQDHLFVGINILPFIMTVVTCIYALVMPEISKKERLQTIAIGFFFLVFLYTAPSALLIFWTCNLVWSLLDSILSGKLEWWGVFFNKNELAFHIILALALTAGLIVPTEIYINNASELWFAYKDILKYFFVDTAKYFTVLFVIYIVCWNNKIRGVYLSVLLGLLFCMFLQSYIISIDYGLFDGHEIEWESLTSLGVLNTFIWVFCLGETFVKFKRLRFDMQRVKKYVKPIVFGIVVIQCMVILINLRNNPVQKDIQYEDGKAGILTAKNLYTVSSKNNIIIFLIDAFDAAVFEEIQETNPDVLTQFKDFAFFPDTTSSFGFTIYSLPEIITGRYFDPSVKRYPDFLNEAWNNNPYHDVLKKNNYVINIYTSGDFIDKNAAVDNLITEKIALNDSIANRFNSLVKFRIAPHYLKKLYYQYDSNVQTSMVLNKEVKPYEMNDQKFYANLKDEFRIDEGNNYFKFYHLQGLHYPWVLDENLEPIQEGEKGTARRAALGRLKIVREYMDLLRNRGLYDNASIVIIADHGQNHILGRRPVLLMKQPHISHDSLFINNRSSTVAELMPFICQRFKESDNNDSKNLTYEKDRFFYLEAKEGGFRKYRIKNNAKESKSWEALGKVDAYRGGDRTYYIGDVIDFSSFGNSSRYKGKGWSINPTVGYSDIKQFEAEMDLDVANALNQNKYIFKLRIYPCCLSLFNMPYVKLKLNINGSDIGNWRFERPYFEEVSCIIPNEVLNIRSLKLNFVVEVPDAFKDDPGVKANVKFIVDKMQIVQIN